MQCGIPVLGIECPEAANICPVHRIINQILTIQAELSFMIALFVDMSIPGEIY